MDQPPPIPVESRVPVWLLIPLGLLPMALGVAELSTKILTKNLDDNGVAVVGLTWAAGSCVFLLVWAWLLFSRLGLHPVVQAILALIFGAVMAAFNLGVTAFVGCLLHPPRF